MGSSVTTAYIKILKRPFLHSNCVT